MEQNNYHSSITTNVSPKEAFENIARVDAWWAKNFTGYATKTGDTFTVQFGATKVDFVISEAIPEKKIVWLVTDCHLPFLNDKNEWTGTSVNWEIGSENGETRIDMTHIGINPGVECFEICNAGWNRHIQDSLNNLMNKGEGKPS